MTRTELHDEVARRLLAQEPGDVVARAFSDGVAALIASATPPGAPIAVLAQGGLARRDLVPFSDVDVLILVDGDPAAAGDAATKPLYALWDQGFRVGHAVRSVEELPALFDSVVEKDGHAATALLEARPIAGDLALAERTLKHVRRELFPAKRQALLDEKVRELHARRARFGGSAYAQEPDIKSSPGGLRDVHGLLWIGLLRVGEAARASADGDLVAGLLAAGVLYPGEADALRFGRRELLAVRAALHLAVSRADDRLHAAHAEKAAALLDTAPGHAGETSAEALCRRAVSAMAVVKCAVDDALVRLVPRAHVVAVADVSGPVRPPPHRDLAGGFVDVDGELHIDADAPLDLAAIVDAARLLAENDLVPSGAFSARRASVLRGDVDGGIDAGVPGSNVARGLPMRSGVHTAESSARIDAGHAIEHAAGVRGTDAMRALARLCASTSVHTKGDGPFTRLLEWGALGRALVEIDRLHSRVKLDGVHALTTDAHLARCADLALAMVSGASPAPLPLQPSLARTTRPHLVVLAALFHDMGKGLPEDHSVVGERIVEREAARMGIPVDEIEILRLLVRDHLVLSRTSQRRDLADPAVIDEIGAAVRTPEMLDLLALLTWVDMCAVAPGVGTEWKARLLGTAVERTRAALLAPDGAVMKLVDDEVRARARAVLARDEREAPHFWVGARASLADRFVDGATVRFLASRSDDELLEDALAFARFVDDEPRPTSIVKSAAGFVHEVRVVAPDRPGLLADVAAGLASEGASVLHAALDVRSDGVAFDCFVVDDGRGRAIEGETAARLPAAVVAAAEGTRAARVVRGGRVREGGVRIPPRVRVLPSDSFGRTVVEVRGADRIGLLADLARAFAEHGYSIALARIHTEGPRVTDVFTVEQIASAPASVGALETALVDAIR